MQSYSQVFFVRTGKTGCPWARVEIKDAKTSAVASVKAWSRDAKSFATAAFLGTYDFIAFQTEPSDFGSDVELKWARGSSFQKSATPLDHGDDWDVKEYAPLSDVSGSGSGSMDFIAKVMEVCTEADSFIDVKFIDDKDVEAIIKVDQCFREILEVGKVYVMHRVKSSGGLAVLEATAMLTLAPQGYLRE